MKKYIEPFCKFCKTRSEKGTITKKYECYRKESPNYMKQVGDCETCKYFKVSMKRYDVMVDGKNYKMHIGDRVMTEIKIIVPTTPPSLNKQARTWRGRHFQKKNLLKTWRTLILQTWGRNIRPKLENAEISLHIFYADKRKIKDQDNIIGAFKPILDLLVKMEFLFTDHPAYLSWGKVTQEIDKLSERTEIILREMN